MDDINCKKYRDIATVAISLYMTDCVLNQKFLPTIAFAYLLHSGALRYASTAAVGT